MFIPLIFLVGSVAATVVLACIVADVMKWCYEFIRDMDNYGDDYL